MQTLPSLSGVPEFCTDTPFYRGCLSKEVSTDFLLPDYYGDIHRVLSVTANARIDDSYATQDALDFSGSVDFSVLYLTEEGHLRALSFSDGFDGDVEIAGLDRECDCSVLPTVESAACRVQSPRKLTAKCRLSIAVTATHEVCLAPAFDGHYTTEEEASMQYDRTEVSAMSAMQLVTRDLSVAEAFTLDENAPPIGEITCSRATMHVEECRATAGELSCRGTLLLSLLYRVEGTEETEHYAEVFRKLPFTAAVPADALSADYACRAVATVTDCKVVPETNAYGEMKTIALDLSYDLLALCAVNLPRTLTRDAFSTKYPTIITEAPLAVTRFAGHRETAFSETETKPRTAIGAEGASSVLSVLGEVRADDLLYDAEKHRLVFHGKANLTLLFLCGETEALADAAVTVPLHCELPLSGEALTGEQFIANCTLLAATAKLEAEQVVVSVEVALGVTLTTTETVSMVEKMALDTAAPYARDDAALRLCYPSSGTPLWEIAKTYHTAPDAILTANKLTASDVQNAPFLLIPCL